MNRHAHTVMRRGPLSREDVGIGSWSASIGKPHTIKNRTRRTTRTTKTTNTRHTKCLLKCSMVSMINQYSVLPRMLTKLPLHACLINSLGKKVLSRQLMSVALAPCTSAKPWT